MVYRGSCHCGGIAFEVEGEVESAMACNCSLCSRRGSLLWFVSREKFRLRTPQEAAATYRFNKHVISHRFCPACGIHAYGEAVDAKGRPTVAINIRCIEDFDLNTVRVEHFDGRSL